MRNYRAALETATGMLRTCAVRLPRRYHAGVEIGTARKPAGKCAESGPPREVGVSAIWTAERSRLLVEARVAFLLCRVNAVWTAQRSRPEQPRHVQRMTAVSMPSGRLRDPDRSSSSLRDWDIRCQCRLDGSEIQTWASALCRECGASVNAVWTAQRSRHTEGLTESHERSVSMPSGRLRDPDPAPPGLHVAISPRCQCHLDGREIQTIQSLTSLAPSGSVNAIWTAERSRQIPHCLRSRAQPSVNAIWTAERSRRVVRSDFVLEAGAGSNAIWTAERSRHPGHGRRPRRLDLASVPSGRQRDPDVTFPVPKARPTAVCQYHLDGR